MKCDQEEAEAWVGDSVLGIFVRRWILAEHGKVNGELYGRLTSNAFLQELGDPTAVEAEIGRCFEKEGLESACAMLEERIFPALLRKEEAWQRREAQMAEAKAKTSKRSRWKREREPQSNSLS